MQYCMLHIIQVYTHSHFTQKHILFIYAAAGKYSFFISQNIYYLIRQYNKLCCFANITTKKKKNKEKPSLFIVFCGIEPHISTIPQKNAYNFHRVWINHKKNIIFLVLLIFFVIKNNTFWNILWSWCKYTLKQYRTFWLNI